MRTTKIVLIGAASASFGPRTIRDALLTPELRGSTLTLVDIDAERLEVMAAFADRLNQSIGAGLRFEHTTDRTEALPGAEFVITSVAVKRNELWQLDFQIPLRHGIKQVLGENGGPGGLSHALRQIPLVLGIARDVEKLAPNALLLNFSNPMSRICLAVCRNTGVRCIGLCHGINGSYRGISRITGIDVDDLKVFGVGLNHFAWVWKVHRKSTGEDVYPILREAERTYDPAFRPLTRRLFRDYGLYPYPSDNHIGEYLSFAWEDCGLKGNDFSGSPEKRKWGWEKIARIARGDDPVPPPEPGEPSRKESTPEDRLRFRRSDEEALSIIASALANRHDFIEAVNIPNEGLIGNLPDWAIVEVPAVVGADGVRGVKVGDLPGGIAALLNTQVHVQDLVTDAAVHGSRELALQALLADPVVQSAEAAGRALDELLHVHRDCLPQFTRP
jgi:alpha-galactosidase